MLEYQRMCLWLTCPPGQQEKVERTCCTSLLWEQSASAVDYMWVKFVYTDMHWKNTWYLLMILVFRASLLCNLGFDQWILPVICKCSCAVWIRTVEVAVCFLQAYQTIKGDKRRYQDRIDELASRPHKAAIKEAATSIQSEPPSE